MNMIKIRPWLALLLVVVLLLGTVSCEHGTDGTDEGVTFTDALGRTVTVPHKPQRVAALLGSFADVWVLAGGSLCAAAEDAWEDFDLELPDTVCLGGAHSPSLELLIAADPDFVIASASTASNISMREALEAMGICVAYFDVDCFADYLAMLDICTDIMGRKDLYEQHGTSLAARIEQVKAEYASLGYSEAERRVLLLRVSSTSIKAKGSEGTILGEMLADMGCVNIADRDGTLLETLGVESVIREEPQHIFIVTMGSNPDAAEAAIRNLIEENPAWGELAAVQNDRLHLMDRSLFNLKPNARWAQAYEILLEALA